MPSAQRGVGRLSQRSSNQAAAGAAHLVGRQAAAAAERTQAYRARYGDVAEDPVVRWNKGNNLAAGSGPLSCLTQQKAQAVCKIMGINHGRKPVDELIGLIKQKIELQKGAATQNRLGAEQREQRDEEGRRAADQRVVAAALLQPVVVRAAQDVAMNNVGGVAGDMNDDGIIWLSPEQVAKELETKERDRVQKEQAAKQLADNERKRQQEDLKRQELEELKKKYSRLCEICLHPNPPRRTAIIPCGNIICKVCAETLAAKQPQEDDNKLTCPICNKPQAFVHLVEKELDEEMGE